MKEIGLYLHIPFCSSKCPYCDFYSFRTDDESKEKYVNSLIEEIEKKSKEYNTIANTLYIGGGTPSVLSGQAISRIVEASKKCFSLENSEITVECNPNSVSKEFFSEIAESGVNRISMGLQSANDNERKKLGRIADKSKVKKAIEYARNAGIKNISLDVMLGIPDSTLESLENTLEFCISENVEHISCYILKIEENTPFYKMQDKLNLPDEDTVADMYLFMCDYLEKNGYNQYEISNFSKKGYESKHNLKYWNCEEYLGLGASAHSFIDSKRFFCERNAEKFIYTQDGNGGDFEEYAMLKLRLRDGLTEKETQSRFGIEIPKEMRKKAEKFAEMGLVNIDENSISLTQKGFLLSNTVISELIY